MDDKNMNTEITTLYKKIIAIKVQPKTYNNNNDFP